MTSAALHLVASQPRLLDRTNSTSSLRRVAPYEVIVDKIKVYQSDNGRDGWRCLVFTDESHRNIWWTQSLEDFSPAEQATVAALVKTKYGIVMEPT